MSKENEKSVLTKKRKIQLTIVSIVLGLTIIIAFGEIAIRIFNPQPYLSPRWQFSNGYGAMLYPNVTMTNAMPGKWQFKYKINDLQYRGKLIPIADTYSKDNIVILGDSYGFGTGVNDGEEFAAILASQVNEDYEVINLSVGGWGLTQQIRRYYEFGMQYKPKVVVLQYCNNDLKDNFSNKVTIIENNQFKFIDSDLSINWVKKYMSKSFIQKSQIYNLFRNNLYKFFERKAVAAHLNKFEKQNNEIPTEEKFYGDLLTLFVNDLHKQGIEVIMISVNKHLERSKHVNKIVDELNDNNYLNYVNVTPWFENIDDFGSPEGHIWGEIGHRILGENLAKVILEDPEIDNLEEVSY